MVGDMEIKATELRIGNLITIHDCLQEVVELPLPVNCIEENTKPIPLTEEWLLKFGFIKSYNSFGDTFHIMNKDNITSDFDVEYWSKGNGKWRNSWYIKQTIKPFNIKYVHQLQNLFFALTGKELELCLKE